ncbi:MAG: hypothetical protein HY698_07650 [Deltaproteobacteria bacterium]|nr:hypothetical protein [Deltaproteobacteria bacterium]
MSANSDAVLWTVLIAGGAAALFAGGRRSVKPRRALGDTPRSEPAPTEVPAKRRVIKDDVEVLGRAIHSEIGRGSREQKVAVAWVARNLSKEKGQPIWRVLCAPCGAQAGHRRPMSTRLAARPEDLVVASEVLASPESDDPTGGATHHVDPRVRAYPKIRKRWIEEYKWEPYKRIGEELELWGPSKTQ